MRYLGIDYGTKRVGIALSDEGGQMAFPREVMPSGKDLALRIKEIVTKEHAGTVVIGESRNSEGKENPLMVKVHALIAELKHTIPEIPVVLHPEFFTSHQASHFAPKGVALDASAAAIMLQAYLDKKHNSGV